MLTHAQIQQFKIDGYLILPNLLDKRSISSIRKLTTQHLADRIEPFELEIDVNYPGAPKDIESSGGKTIRRLKMAYQRSQNYADIGANQEICDAIGQILGGNRLLINPNHHNCVMTKLPQFSSITHWHRDTRYWNFDNKYLINAWVALGQEKESNGCMKILPGSHRWDVRKEALDQAQFLIQDHSDNKSRLETQRLVELNAGDVLLFSAHCFHAAGRNSTDQAKFSLVFTYHNEQTKPLQNTHSASSPPIQVR